ncbi:WxL domain-containing protein [Siminovitchia fortis]|uniref:WxL domain-containing protein n=1 Tax=Siminovitchia fortis TaxID=254758 RepID=UPI0011A3267C|nr:WxL domain-containing protein [Siminovitchia fortis]
MLKKFSKKLFGVGLVSVMSLSFATGAFADTKSNEVDVTIKSGEFSLATSDIESFGEIELKSTPQTYKTSFNDKFTVKDLRGTQAGWRVDVSASQFTDGTNTLPKGTLSLEPVSSIKRVGTGQGALPVKTMDSNKVIDDGTVAVVKADTGGGMGVFDFEFPKNALSIVVDPTTAKVLNGSKATYQSTLKWDLVQAP